MILPLLALLGQPKYPLVRLEEEVERNLRPSDLRVSILKKKLPALFQKAGLGVHLYRDPWIKPVLGVKGEFLVLVSRTGKDFLYGATFHLAAEGGTVHASLVQDQANNTPKYEGIWMLFGQALRRGDRLYVIGNGFTTANWEQPGAKVYQRYQGRWNRLSSTMVAEMAGEPGPRFKDGEPNTVLISIRRYPANLSAPHAGPLISCDAILHLRKDRYERGEIHRRDTAMALMDDIVGCFQKDDVDGFSALVPTPLLKRLWSGLERQVAKAGLSVTSNILSDNDDAQELVLREANLLLVFGKQGGRTQLKEIRWHRGY